jgi:hypothetical protein
MHAAPATFADIRKLLADVGRYVLRQLIESICDLVRIPLAILAALLSLLSARSRPTRRALLMLLVDTAREMVLIPIALAATALDLLLAWRQAPRHFYATQQLGERWASRLDRWFVMRPHPRHLRVLGRWYQRQQRRAQQAGEAATP